MVHWQTDAPASRQTVRSPGSARLRERECFVCIQLPGSTEVVTCGRFAQEETVTGGVVGRFVYGRSYRLRPDAVPLDLFNLPLSDRVYTTAKLGGIFGALRDASPDRWGRLVIERALGRTDLTEVDVLLQSPEDRAGALSHGERADGARRRGVAHGSSQLVVSPAR